MGILDHLLGDDDYGAMVFGRKDTSWPLQHEVQSGEALHFLSTRQSKNSSTDTLLNLLADPFQSDISANSIYAALIWSFALAGALFLLFVLLRPRTSHVYARRLKVADEKHAPPPLDRTLFGWVPAITRPREDELVETIGLDAVIFLRFIRMLRNLFIILTIIGCGVIIPINLTGGHDLYDQYKNVKTLLKLTPQYIQGERFWAFVVCAYIFQAIVCAFIWWNYRTVLRLRQRYFRSDDYVKELHSRTLLVRHLPAEMRSDAGIAEIVSTKFSPDELPRTAVGRNVRRWDLEELMEGHDKAVRKLESILAKYLANPERLPSNRPTCKPWKGDMDMATDGKGKVDAIDYYDNKIAKLRKQIFQARDSVDQRDPESYGFASYSSVENAHAVAHMNRVQRKIFGKSTPRTQNTSISPAPRPSDILWQNLPMTRKMRIARARWDGLWILLLTIAFIVPNVLTSVFLSDFSHLGLFWPAFNDNLRAHKVAWGIAQGIVAPTVQLLFYMFLPWVFRRLLTHSGDPSRTIRERHVTSRLYGFFVFNNLIFFSIFASAFRYAAAVVAAKRKGEGTWESMRDGQLFVQLMIGLCNTTTYWLTWQMQHNLSAATDISQLLPLVMSWFKKRFTNPTPRELIELSAPQSFAYADYYNNFLFVATVGLCFATLQPIIIPVTAFYLGIEVWWKKYMLQYILFTKVESGGAFWRMVYNRMLFAVLLSNAVIALVVGAQGVGNVNAVKNGGMLYAMIPLPFLLFGFKYYIVKNFDSKMSFIYPNPVLGTKQDEQTMYYDREDSPKGKQERQTAQLAAKFGHPALHKPLINIMVHKRAQHLLPEVLSSYRLTKDRKGSVGSTDGSGGGGSGEDNYYSDMDTSYRRPGAPAYSDSAILMSPLGHDGRASAGAPAAAPYGPYRTESAGHASDTGSTALLVQPLVEVVGDADLDIDRWKSRPGFRDEFGGDGALYGRPEDLVPETPPPPSVPSSAPFPGSTGRSMSWETDDDGGAAGARGHGGSAFATLDDAIKPGLEHGPVSGVGGVGRKPVGGYGADLK